MEGYPPHSPTFARSDTSTQSEETLRTSPNAIPVERHRRGTWLLVVVLSLSLVATGAAAGTATPATVGDDRPTMTPASLSDEQQDDEANNSSVQHERPESASEDGDLARLEQWLGGELGSQLGESTLQLSQGEYDAAREMLGDDYSDTLGKFVDVAGETESESGDDSSPEEQQETLNQTRDTQREYIDSVESFQEVYDQYQAAKEAGNDSRARELARIIHERGDNAEELTAALRTNYTAVETIIGVSLEAEIERINQTTANITEIRDTVIVAEFIQTELTVSRSTASASFENPATITGQIQTAATASSGPPNGTVTLQIADRRLETTVTDDGRFSVDYRPTTAPVGQQSIPVQYTPQPDSIYLGATANTSLRIEQVQASIDLEENQEQLRFGQPVGVAGRVTVNETAVPGASLSVRIAGTTLGTVETDEDGQFRAAAPLPATVRPGEQPIRVAPALDDRAVRPAATDGTATVVESETELSVTGEWQTNGVFLNGQLTTVDGEPAPGQQVRISVNGTHRATTQTDENGAYSVSIEGSQPAGENQTLGITVAFDGSDTNLANASGRTILQAPADSSAGPPNQAESGNGDPVRQVVRIAERDGVWPGIVLACIGVIGGVYWWRRRAGRPTPESATAAASTDMDTEREGPSAAPSSAEATPTDPLQPATDALEAGDNPDHAIRYAYSTVRNQLATEFDTVDVTDGPLPVTHWAFYDAYRDSITDPEPFRELTAMYERSAYAAAETSAADGEDAVAVAREILAELDAAAGPVEPEAPS